MPPDRTDHPLSRIYRLLETEYGPQHWWPADSPLEVVVGAILTQNTNWRNVESALGNLKRAGALSTAGLAALPTEKLEALIRPSGYFRQKTRRLQLFIRHLRTHHRGDLDALLAQPLATLRAELLSLEGIGPETADSIILYAAHKPSFVIDAYTVRLLLRFGLIDADPGYETLRNRFMQALPCDVPLYNQYHALIVRLGKECCTRRSPRCGRCPLRAACATGRRALPADRS